ncbi:MAG: ethanolamine ammonia-lyase reactivating factor EutA [Clostridiales bacterium]|nr:ethanolamine ammonia-lyase reactivating factor EutA [Clostridiales bacterium]
MEEILSVGIDIGTSTTQVVFARFTLDNTAGYFSAPHVTICDKKIVYKSQAVFTPLKTASLIDGAAVRAIVDKEYAKAQIQPTEVQTGAVIITGESARKENAAEVLRQLSEFAGEFVVSTAGPDLESVIAGKGSGAWQYSMRNECLTVNLDVGGGTTNLAAFEDGETISVGCYDIGGRLVRLDKDGTISYSSEAARLAADTVGVSLSVGRRVSAAELERVTDKMAALLAQSVGLLPEEPLLRRVKTAGSSDFQTIRKPSRFFFSGGVAACMENEETNPLAFGDIGVLLGQSIKKTFSALSAPFQPGGETLRATVVGAGSYTTSLSGSTIFYTEGVFPLKNLPVCKLTAEEETDCFEGRTEKLGQRVRRFLQQNQTSELALFLEGKSDPTYKELQNLANAAAAVLEQEVPVPKPLLVSVRRDMAKALGLAMHRCLPDRKLAVIDSVQVGQNDYIDVGRPLMEGLVVPVIVKTLLFG